MIKEEEREARCLAPPSELARAFARWRLSARQRRPYRGRERRSASYTREKEGQSCAEREEDGEEEGERESEREREREREGQKVRGEEGVSLSLSRCISGRMAAAHKTAGCCRRRRLYIYRYPLSLSLSLTAITYAPEKERVYSFAVGCASFLSVRSLYVPPRALAAATTAANPHVSSHARLIDYFETERPLPRVCVCVCACVCAEMRGVFFLERM